MGKLEAAKAYIQAGLSVIPLKPNSKVPAVIWRDYTKRHATFEEINKWFGNGVDNNIGIVTGKISNLIVVDRDEKNLPLENQSNVQVVTPRGVHDYFQYKEGVNNAVGINGHKIDLRSEGGYVVAPPSTVNGKGYYRVMGSGLIHERPEFKEFTFQVVKESFTTVTVEQTIEGSRNQTTTRYVGKLLQQTPEKDWDTYAWNTILAYNNTYNKPPLDLDELGNIFDSIAHREEASREEKPKEDMLFKPTPIDVIFDMKIPNPGYMVDKLVTQEGITIIAGTPGSFKTWLLFNIAKCVADETSDFLNKYTTKHGGVLIIDKENGLRRIRRRLSLLGVLDYHNIFVETNPHLYINNSTIIQIRDFCLSNNIKLVTLDSLRRVFDGNENDSKEINRFLNCLKVLKEAGISIVLIHHYNKPVPGMKQSMRGSSDLEAGVDSVIEVKRTGIKSVIVTQTRDQDADSFLNLSLTVVSDPDDFEFKEEIHIRDEVTRGGF